MSISVIIDVSVGFITFWGSREAGSIVSFPGLQQQTVRIVDSAGIVDLKY